MWGMYGKMVSSGSMGRIHASPCYPPCKWNAAILGMENDYETSQYWLVRAERASIMSAPSIARGYSTNYGTQYSWWIVAAYDMPQQEAEEMITSPAFWRHIAMSGGLPDGSCHFGRHPARAI